VIVYRATICHVEVVTVWLLYLRTNNPDWLRYILPIAFRLAIRGNGKDLKRECSW
jgi:hypothetical protein